MAYKVVVENGVPALSEEISKLIKDLPKMALAVVKQSAAYERQSHRYRNRTGNLQRSTQGTMMRSSPSDIRLQLVMAQPYASFVVEKGLSNIYTAANDAEEAITEMIEKLFSAL